METYVTGADTDTRSISRKFGRLEISARNHVTEKKKVKIRRKIRKKMLTKLGRTSEEIVQKILSKFGIQFVELQINVEIRGVIKK